ncbi:MAG TPA: hypothetical protein VMZ53_32265 [Kofleriaceae bacterium]|nr:hypothetical protein [Kofleriaceae bacterium]
MNRCVVLAALVCAAACGKRQQVESGVGSGVGSDTCEQLPFAASVPVAEASGAAWLEVGGKQALVVNADSGHRGEYAIIDPETGNVIEQGSLPLGQVPKDADDIEGLATRGGMLYGLQSSGWMRVWKRVGSGFELVDGPYPIATGDNFSCAIDDGNCGKNYEGLAIAPKPNGPCAGFACSKEDGHLYCLVEQQDGRFAVDRTKSIAVERKGVLADCAFSPLGKLFVGNNMFGNSTVYVVDGWADPAKARVEEVGELGVGFPEAIAVDSALIYRLSDTGGSPSMMAKFRCLAPGR